MCEGRLPSSITGTVFYRANSHTRANLIQVLQQAAICLRTHPTVTLLTLHTAHNQHKHIPHFNK